jgi:hypothetical protein
LLPAAIALVGMVAIGTVALTRSSTYTVAELVKSYHPGMNGRVVRVRGPVLHHDRGTANSDVTLATPDGNAIVEGSDCRDPGRQLARGEVVTLVGTIEHEFRQGDVPGVELRDAHVEP